MNVHSPIRMKSQAADSQVDKITTLDSSARFHPGGMAAISRWLRPKADTTGLCAVVVDDPRGVAALRPLRGRRSFVSRFRWCRPSALPPANSFDPSGVVRNMAFLL